MKKILLIMVSMLLFACEDSSDDELYLQDFNFEKLATDGDGTIIPPPPPEDDDCD